MSEARDSHEELVNATIKAVREGLDDYSVRARVLGGHREQENHPEDAYGSTENPIAALSDSIAALASAFQVAAPEEGYNAAVRPLILRSAAMRQKAMKLEADRG